MLHFASPGTPPSPHASPSQRKSTGLFIRPDNSVEMYVDGEMKASGSLLKDMQPPVNPPKDQLWSMEVFGLVLERKSRKHSKNLFKIDQTTNMAICLALLVPADFSGIAAMRPGDRRPQRQQTRGLGGPGEDRRSRGQEARASAAHGTRRGAWLWAR